MVRHCTFYASFSPFSKLVQNQRIRSSAFASSSEGARRRQDGISSGALWRIGGLGGLPLCDQALLLLLLDLLFLGRQGPELQGVNTAFPGHFFREEGVYHPVPRGLHFGFESIGNDDQSEVSLGRGATLHGLVVSVQVRVIVDLKGPRIEGSGNLCPDGLFYRRTGAHGRDLATYG